VDVTYVSILYMLVYFGMQHGAVAHCNAVN